MATYLAIASNFKVELEDFSCRTVAKLEMVDGKYLITQAELFPKIKLKDSNDAEKAQRIADKSKAGCLVTNSMKTEILMTTKIS